MPSVMSVQGLISEDQMGFTLPHEHLFTDLHCYWKGEAPDAARRAYYDQPITAEIRPAVQSDPWAFRDNTFLDSEEKAIIEAEAFRRAGGRTIVDLSPYGSMGRNPQGLLHVAQKVGVNVIMSVGRYSEPTMTVYEKQKSVADLVGQFLDEFLNGVEDCGIKPGLLKVGFVDKLDKEAELCSLRAAGRVQGQVGCALSVHPHIWEPDSHQILDILEAEGCDLRRVILCHQDFLGDQVDYLDSLVKRGAFLEFDTFGSGLLNDPMWQLTEAQKIRNVQRQIERGNLAHLLISGDMCLKVMLSSWGGAGLVNLPLNTLPAMKAAGISDEALQILVEENPKIALCY